MSRYKAFAVLINDAESIKVAKSKAGARVAMHQGLPAMIVKLQGHFQSRISEWLLSAILLSWGIACWAASPELWRYVAGNTLLQHFGQEVWGAYAVLLGSARLAALFINGAVQRSPHLRSAGAFLSVFLWLQLTFGVFTGQAGIAISIYPWLLVTDIYNVLRASRDAKISDLRFGNYRGAKLDATAT